MISLDRPFEYFEKILGRGEFIGFEYQGEVHLFHRCKRISRQDQSLGGLLEKSFSYLIRIPSDTILSALHKKETTCRCALGREIKAHILEEVSPFHKLRFAITDSGISCTTRA